MRLMKTPRSVELALTSRCNLRCKYCSHFASAGQAGQDLPKEEWIQFFAEMNRCAVLEVTLSGGEPFCRKDLTEIVEGLVCNRMRFDILSNGTLITEEVAAFLAATGRCNGVQVSIDGSIPTTHDACRGEGSFLKAIQGIKTLQKYRLSVSVRVTIHQKNVGDLESIARFLLEEMELQNFSTNAATYMGLCRQNTDQIQLSVQDRSVAMENLLRLHKKYNGRISAAAGPLAEAKNWLEMEMASQVGRAPISGRGYLTGCGGPMSKMAVRADGVMVPCIQMSHVELGRVNKDDLREVWLGHPELVKLRERRSISLTKFEFCQGCGYINYCTGNCPALAYTILGEAQHPSPDACLKRFLEAGGRLPDKSLAG